ncbi:ubiquitin-associated protein 2b isoform X2 [Triplophysa dalaica]|nr:ubiquitin-associated protein 2b isoform X2 [Triplophysa dalaica]
MMTSVVADAARGNRDRALPQTTHTSQPQKQIQATAEQIQLARMIYDKNDADFEGKVQQLMEVTGKTQDECMVALHDCNGDVNRAINFLLEEVIDKDSWETVGKKKNVGKEGTPAEKRGEREGRGRGGLNRRGRGGSRNHEGRSEENVFDSAPGERGDRGRRGRGRGVVSGAGGRGRGRGAGISRTFNPVDYSSAVEAGETGTETTEGAGAWMDNLEDWAAEDWNEDLSETKVFTASSALGSKNHVQGMELSSLLSKEADGDSDLAGLELSSPGTLTQSLVFTNSQQHGSRAHTHSYASAAAGTYAHAASSMLGPRHPHNDVQKAEPISALRVAPVTNQVHGGLSNGAASKESTAPAPPEPTPKSLNEPKETPVTVAQLDLKGQPDPSPILSQLSQNSALQSDLPAQARNHAVLPPHDGPLQSLQPLSEPAGTMAEPSQPKNIRPLRRRAPPPSKIPSSAVEMPGSADVSGLNVQFGALDFGSDSKVENLNQSETGFQEPAAAPQNQSSLYSKSSAVSESLSALPPAVIESSYPTASRSLQSTTAPPVLAPTSNSRAESSTTTPLSNGFGEIRSSSTQDAVLSNPPQPVSSILPSENGLSTLSSSSSTSVPALNTSLSSCNSLGSSVPASSSLSSQMGGDVSASLPVFSSSVSSAAVSSNGIASGAQNLTVNGTSAPSTGRSLPLQTSITPSTNSGKAPPNLAQGVPPLLASQYIMGPGGLLPAYPPIYGYEDLQMMQSRLPMDYYGMTFPGTALAGRDGGLGSNPYSGEPTKFGRNDSNSPAPATSLSSVPPSQTQSSVPQNQGPQNPGQAQQGQTQAFLNPPLPPGYGYTSLPYYPGMPGVPSAFQYGPTVFMPQASTKQHTMGPSSQYQHQAGYSQHAYGAGFDELSQAHAVGDYGKGGYGGNSQSQAKAMSNSAGKAPGMMSGSASSELTGTVYSKTQTFDKQGFTTAAAPPFSLPSALGGTGPLNPTGAPGYAPAPYLHILPPHQQPPSQLLHHHMAQDTQGQRSQSSSMQKNQAKSNYSNSPYWAN